MLFNYLDGIVGISAIFSPCQGTGFWLTDGKCLLHKWTDKHKNAPRESRSTYQMTLDENSHFTQIAHAHTQLHSDEIRQPNSMRKLNVFVCGAGCERYAAASEEENEINASNEGETSVTRQRCSSRAHQQIRTEYFLLQKVGKSNMSSSDKLPSEHYSAFTIGYVGGGCNMRALLCRLKITSATVHCRRRRQFSLRNSSQSNFSRNFVSIRRRDLICS